MAAPEMAPEPLNWISMYFPGGGGGRRVAVRFDARGTALKEQASLLLGEPLRRGAAERTKVRSGSLRRGGVSPPKRDELSLRIVLALPKASSRGLDSRTCGDGTRVSQRGSGRGSEGACSPRPAGELVAKQGCGPERGGRACCSTGLSDSPRLTARAAAVAAPCGERRGRVLL